MDCPDRVRTRIWYDAVKFARDRARSEHGRAWQTRPETRELTKHFGKWAPYRRGEHVPNDPSSQTNPIDVAEASVPGTARWFRSPIWSAVQGNLSNWLEIEDYLLAIAGNSAMLCREPQVFHGKPVRKIAVEHVVKSASLDGLDLIETVVLLLERGRTRQWHELTRAAIGLFDATTEKIAHIPEIQRNYGPFFEAIERRYINSAFDEASNFLEPWHVRLRNASGFDVAQELLQMFAPMPDWNSNRPSAGE